MGFQKHTKTVAIAVILIALALNASLGFADTSASIPRQILLTWQNSPQTTMTITWRTDTKVEQPKILFRADKLFAKTRQAIGTSEKFDNTLLGGPANMWLNTVELTGLRPGAEYHVTIPHESKPEKFTFRTAPKDRKKIVFAAFSDTHFASEEMLNRCKKLFETIAEEDPDFCLGTGDFWYGEEKQNVEVLLDLWFDLWHEKMITADGRRIPLIPAEGNHDRRVPGPDHPQDITGSPLFYQRFKTPPPHAYYITPYNAELAIITLNSEHSAPIAGDQTEWLRQQLAEYQNSRWLIVQHHVAPYAAFKTIASREEAIRQNWVPLYEQYGVDLVISGHDHTYTQTHPLKNNQIDNEEGLVYLITNGCGGPREPDRERGYIKETDQKLAYWRCILTQKAGISTLQAVPVFPFDKSYSGQPYITCRNRRGQPITCPTPIKSKK